jgi:hypothetical protein
MEASRPRATRSARRSVPLIVAVLGLAGVLGGCMAPSDDSSTSSTVDAEREGREPGDIEAAVGDTIEVFGITATVLEVGRVESFNELDTSGYIWAEVRVENTTDRGVEFHRRHFRLEKPDGSLSNTANISTESQIEGGSTARSDELEPGEVREGRVIYTAGDLEGQFAIVYIPQPPNPDTIDRERGVWVFESSPDDAE